MTPIFSPWPEMKDGRAAFFDGNAASTEVEKWLGSEITSVSLRQIHGNRVIQLDRIPDEKKEGDAMVTRLPGVALHVYTADCLPLLAHDGDVIGACHAGWRGLAAGIIENWIGALGALGASKGNLKIAIGPAIGVCHFEVGKDVSGQILAGVPVKFLNLFRKPHPDPAKDFIDLKELARFKLAALGISPDHVSISSRCTYCDPQPLPSYRRDGKGAGRLQAVIVKSRG